MAADRPPASHNLPRIELGQDWTPATPAKMARLREIERARQKYDPHYITAAEAREIPQEIVDSNPELQHRIRYSQPEWPEGQASATEALGELPAGQGESIERRRMDAASLFTPPRED